MLNITPEVSVIMAVYNGQETIEAAAQSIVLQSFKNWELIIIDDCSSDDTSSVLDNLQNGDSRINVFRNHWNLGLPATLNKAIQNCRGKYITRMDADDFSYPNRLETQLNFLKSNPDIAVVGGNAHLCNPDGDIIRATDMPSSPNDIKKKVTKLCPLIHPTVMYHKYFICDMGGYDERLKKKQDYDLWLRGVNKYKYSNIPDVVLKYQVSPYKPLTTDLYGFYVRTINAHRQKNYLKGLFWACTVLTINLLRRAGYRQRMHRQPK